MQGEGEPKPAHLVQLLFDYDFLGEAAYTREVLYPGCGVPRFQACLLAAKKCRVSHRGMSWEVHPLALCNNI